MSKVDKVTQVKKMIQANDRVRASEVMKKLNITRQYAYNLMSDARKAIRHEIGSLSHLAGLNATKDSIIGPIPPVPPAPPAPLPVTMFDTVNHPPHYKVGGIETIDFIEAKGLNYHLGNVVKYITRADHKGDRLENLRKAKWYLEREIENAAK